MSKINLEDLLNQSPFYFYLLVVDEFLDINLHGLKNFEKIYLSDYPSVKIKNSGKLLSNSKVIQHISQKQKQNHLIPAIIPFKPSAKIDLICQQNNWINVNNPAPINRFLEDKIKFAKLCQKYNLPTIPFSIDVLNRENFTKYQQLYGSKLVLQTHFGWAGNSTFSANSWTEIKEKIHPNTIVKFSPLIEDSYSLLNNCCLTHQGLIQSPPGLQYTGIYPFTTNHFTTVGRQWPSFAPSKIIQEINHITSTFSKIINDIGYKGFFGLDFLVTKDKVYLLECNPRLTASFDFYTQLELKQKLNPLFYFHLVEFIKISYHFDLKTEQSRFANPEIIGSELTPKDKNNHTCKKLNYHYALSKSTNPISFPQKLIDQFNEKN